MNLLEIISNMLEKKVVGVFYRCSAALCTSVLTETTTSDFWWDNFWLQKMSFLIIKSSGTLQKSDLSEYMFIHRQRVNKNGCLKRFVTHIWCWRSEPKWWFTSVSWYDSCISVGWHFRVSTKSCCTGNGYKPKNELQRFQVTSLNHYIAKSSNSFIPSLWVYEVYCYSGIEVVVEKGKGFLCRQVNFTFRIKKFCPVI